MSRLTRNIDQVALAIKRLAFKQSAEPPTVKRPPQPPRHQGEREKSRRLRRLAKATAVFLLLSTPVHSAPPEPTWGYTAVIVGNTADWLSTRAALDKGAVESNPFRPDKWQVKVASTTVQVFMVWWLNRTGHHKAANWVGIGIGAGLGGVAIHNWNLPDSYPARRKIQ